MENRLAFAIIAASTSIFGDVIMVMIEALLVPLPEEALP